MLVLKAFFLLNFCFKIIHDIVSKFKKVKFANGCKYSSFEQRLFFCFFWPTWTTFHWFKWSNSITTALVSFTFAPTLSSSSDLAEAFSYVATLSCDRHIPWQFDDCFSAFLFNIIDLKIVFWSLKTLHNVVRPKLA